MNRILYAIREWISFKTPVEILLKECDARGLYALYKLNMPEYNGYETKRLDAAIVRLMAQMDVEAECSCGMRVYMIRPEDKQAFARLCNNYCMCIADRYFDVPAFGRKIIEAKYIEYSQLMTLLK